MARVNSCPDTCLAALGSSSTEAGRTEGTLFADISGPLFGVGGLVNGRLQLKQGLRRARAPVIVVHAVRHASSGDLRDRRSHIRALPASAFAPRIILRKRQEACPRKLSHQYFDGYLVNEPCSFSFHLYIVLAGILHAPIAVDRHCICRAVAETCSSLEADCYRFEVGVRQGI